MIEWPDTISGTVETRQNAIVRSGSVDVTDVYHAFETITPK